MFGAGDTSAGPEFAEFIDDTEGVNHLRLGGALSMDAMNLTPIDGFGGDVYQRHCNLRALNGRCRRFFNQGQKFQQEKY